MNQTRKSLTTGQAAKLVGKNSRTIRRWIDLGKVEGYKTPTNIRYVYQDSLVPAIANDAGEQNTVEGS
jgi:excisionase family DNA binding protein